MKQRLVLFAIAFAGGMLGANMQPILSGAGKLIFPEASPAAAISASSGALTIAAGGSNQSIAVTPSGTGRTNFTGDVNTTGIYRKSGAAGLTSSINVRNNAGTGGCGISVVGGIVTASTC